MSQPHDQTIFIISNLESALFEKIIDFMEENNAPRKEINKLKRDYLQYCSIKEKISKKKPNLSIKDIEKETTGNLWLEIVRKLIGESNESN